MRFPYQARKFANTIPLDVDGNAAALQYFRFEIFTAKAPPFPSMHRPAGKTQAQRQKFLEGRGAGRENLFPKRFSSAQAFLPSNLQAPACRPQNKKIPGGAGTKKRPPRAVSCKGVSNNLWQRPTFPHDVMQYHRRWRA